VAAGAAAIVAIVWAAIVITLAMFESDRNRQRIIAGGKEGVKKRWAFRAFAAEEDLLTELANKAGLSISKSLTVDGSTNDSGQLIGATIPTLPGSPVYYITRLGISDMDLQRRVVDLGRWFALSKFEGSNEYLVSRYFVANYERIRTSYNLSESAAINQTLASMGNEGYALPTADFVTWRDNEFFPAMRTRAWPFESQTVGTGGVRQLASLGLGGPVVFENQTWVECVNVAKATYGAAPLVGAKLRVVGHGEALTWFRFASAVGGGQNVNLVEEKTTLTRLGYKPRASKLWPGEMDYVDSATGYFFSPRMVLYSETGELVQARVS
jgi:hypothetical protein